MRRSTAVRASVVRLPWDSGGVTASHALRCALPLLPGAAGYMPLTDTADMGLSTASCAPGVVKSVATPMGWRVMSGSGVLAGNSVGS